LSFQQQQNYLSHPLYQKHIQELEEEYKVKLLTERVLNFLTQAGEQLVKHAKSILKSTVN
jgi:DNA-binding transcriptional LysR family regulator